MAIHLALLHGKGGQCCNALDTWRHCVFIQGTLLMGVVETARSVNYAK